MSEPRLPLWNRDQTDVLPEYRLTFGHALFKGLPEGWEPLLFKCLELGKPDYVGALQQSRLPKHTQNEYLILGCATETHLILGKMGDVCCVFAPHDFFSGSRKWINFNRKAGGSMAFATQMDVESFYYLLFQAGTKQTDALVEGDAVRVIEDRPISAYLDGKKIFQDEVACSMSNDDALEFVKRDLALKVDFRTQLSVVTRFPQNHQPLATVTHVIFPKQTKRGFFRLRW